MQARQPNMDYEECLMFGEDFKKDPMNFGGPSPFGKLIIIKTPFGDVYDASNESQVKSLLLPGEIGLALYFMKSRKQIKY